MRIWSKSKSYLYYKRILGIKLILQTEIGRVKNFEKKSMCFFVFEIKKNFQIFPARKSQNFVFS